RTINANIFSIHFLLLNKYAGSPSRDPFYGIAHLNTGECSATVVPAEKLEPGWVFLSKFKTSRPERRDGSWSRTECSNRYGGCKKRHLRRRAKHCSEPFFLRLVHRLSA